MNKWGDVYNPTLYPASYRIFAVLRETDPFPFVPVIWIDLKSLYGWPNKSISLVKFNLSLITFLVGLLWFNNTSMARCIFIELLQINIIFKKYDYESLLKFKNIVVYWDLKAIFITFLPIALGYLTNRNWGSLSIRLGAIKLQCRHLSGHYQGFSAIYMISNHRKRYVLFHRLSSKTAHHYWNLFHKHIQQINVLKNF